MTWTALPVPSCTVECERPFSFYFGLIEAFWKTPPSDENPLHRLSTLARKQGARAIVFEDASALDAVLEEISTLDAHMGGGGAAEAILLSFLSEVPVDDDISTVSDRALIGQCTLINYRPPDAAEFENTFIYEAIFATPSLDNGEKLLNNFINCEAIFRVTVGNRVFGIKGLYYAQQNGKTSVCAHACVRMATRTLFPDRPSPSTARINELIGQPPSADGMQIEQLSSVLESLTGHEVASINCRDISAAEYVSVLASAADSGEIALLTFNTGPNPEGHDPSIVEAPPANHVVVVYGYTRNSDEWHPQAIPAYTGAPSALHCPSSAWVDHFIIHDDNYGPYLALSSQALESDKNVRADTILIVRRISTKVNAHVAESAAGIVLAQSAHLFTMDAQHNQWLGFLMRYRKPLVTRPILMTREEYGTHLETSVAHDGSKQPKVKIKALVRSLPATLWIIEFTLPDLYTGNHSKLGEIIFDASKSATNSFHVGSLSGIRMPSRFMLARPDAASHLAELLENRASLARGMQPFQIDSHSPLFERNPPTKQW